MKRQLLFLFSFCLFYSTTLISATQVVDDDTGIDNGVSPFATIAAAISAATAGDIISITGGADNTHTELGISVSKELTIKGAGQSTTIVQAHATQGSATDRVFEITTSAAVIFEDMTIRHGNRTGDGGGVLCETNNADITFNRITISNNNSSGSGGAMMLSAANMTVSFNNCTISDNTASAQAGFLFQGGASNFSMTQCIISGNTAAFSGGAIYEAENGSINTFERCAFINNTASAAAGGAVNAVNTHTYHTYTNCTFSGNTGRTAGGAIADAVSATLTLFACTFTNNKTTIGSLIRGGAIDFRGGINNMTNCIAYGNFVKTNQPNDVNLEGTPLANAADADHNVVGVCTGTCPSGPGFITTDPSLGSLITCTTGLPIHVHEISAGSSAENLGEAAGAPTLDICGGSRNNPPDIGSFEIGAVFPVELVDFQASVLNNKSVKLIWQTSSELNNNGFEILGSIDAKTWRKLNFVEGAGSTSGMQYYNYEDRHPNIGINYYRLKQIDLDGAFEYSSVVSIDLTAKGNLSGLRIAPNPTQSGSFSLILPENEAETIQMTMYDYTGRLVRNTGLFDTQTEINVADLDKGMYVVRVDMDGVTAWERVVVQ